MIMEAATELKTRLINSFTGRDAYYTNRKLAKFLNEHLDEYGDSVESIRKAIEYSQKKQEGKGGFTLVALDEKTRDKNGHPEIIGVVVINETNMSGYIPENILVYIAVHRDYRGKGLGKELMNQALRYCTGDIALHVEKDNPARLLYEKMGFTNPYLEMRLKRK